MSYITPTNYRPPFSQQFMNGVSAAVYPNVVHSRNTFIFNMFVRYYLQKLISVYKFKLPEDWAENYFKYVLMGYGYICVFNTDKYGTVAQKCTLGDTVTLYNQPKFALVTNPVFKKSYQLTIGKNCEVIRLQPDWGSPLDIVSTYADLSTLALETAGINMLNSKTSFVFFAENDSMAATYKKAYDQIASGMPMTVVDKHLMDEQGNPLWQTFTQNVGQNYITDRLLVDMSTIENQFNTLIGIPNANTQKRERLITDEVNSNNQSTSALANLWLEEMQEGIDKVNDMFGLDISVEYRYKEEEPEEPAQEANKDE